MGEGVRTTASGMAVFCGKFRIVERVKGIEPSSSAWEAAALPLSYTREAARRLPRNARGGQYKPAATAENGVRALPPRAARPTRPA